MWIVREVLGTDKFTVRDTHHDTKREALAKIKSLPLGDKPTIGRVGHIYIVKPRSSK